MNQDKCSSAALYVLQEILLVTMTRYLARSRIVSLVRLMAPDSVVPPAMTMPLSLTTATVSPVLAGVTLLIMAVIVVIVIPSPVVAMISITVTISVMVTVIISIMLTMADDAGRGMNPRGMVTATRQGSDGGHSQQKEKQAHGGSRSRYLQRC
ncbi:hypothetical protein BJB45_15875 [Halomonas huangheensis]|uniref:Uncharacterized protein n=1 Tax=Halomonas huangheensis TaxID=1178482 RepID=W1NB20_9GAMM|nr:hypothetical protein AR456_10790 [Halomonas huangheensis]ERL52757.1 hypothetical protein BJB45_15875 [Halomonas huangheensis]